MTALLLRRLGRQPELFLNVFELDTHVAECEYHAFSAICRHYETAYNQPCLHRRLFNL